MDHEAGRRYIAHSGKVDPRTGEMRSLHAGIKLNYPPNAANRYAYSGGRDNFIHSAAKITPVYLASTVILGMKSGLSAKAFAF
jgi:hypothetical protein